MSPQSPLHVASLALLVLAMPASAADPDAAALDRGSEIAYQRALAPAAAERRVNADVAQRVRARRIANRIIAAASAIEPAAQSYSWAVNVVTDAVPDARVYPGGRVLLNHGLVAQSGFTDEEIAAVLAHAAAHSLLGHDARRVFAAAGPQATSADPNRRALALAEATTETLRAPRYSGEEIAAADRASVELLARAAYDPRAAGSAWRRLARGEQGIVERSPVGDARLAALDEAIRNAMALFEEARARAAAGTRPPLPGGARSTTSITGTPPPPPAR